MTALAPLAAAPLAALWTQATPQAVAVLAPADLVGGEAVWMLLLGVSGATGTPAPAPLGMMAGAPLAAPDRPADVPSDAPEIRVSDRGWIGEPDDLAAPNLIWAARMMEPPALEFTLPVLPESARRRVATAGEVLLANGDGALDYLAGDWRVGGQPVTLLRGPHRRPRHAPFAEFVEVARLRARGAASGTSRLALPLRDPGADLSVPLAPLYAGAGGAEGGSDLAGAPKPVLYGIKRRIEPVLVDPARYIYQIHDGAIEEVIAVRDRGAPLTDVGDSLSYAALESFVPGAGEFRTCRSAGMVRVEPAGADGVSLLTVDARGATAFGGYSAGTPASIARKLLLGPGGLSAAALVQDAFGAWPVGEAGLYLIGGTVAEAMDALAAGVAGWWGADRMGRYDGGQATAPEGMGAAWVIQPWMLRAPPEEAGTPDAPRWRTTVGYAAPGRVMRAEDLAGSVSTADRDAWGKEFQPAVAFDATVRATYPQADEAPNLISVFDQEGDAAALATQLQGLHGVPRRTWRVALNRAGLAVQPGTALRLIWPRHGLTSGRTLLARGISIRGDRAELLLWG
ncbi:MULTISPECIES: hypothetical protein [Roseomonadaceae]|uniref:Tip attachment protein J domain-containing protein n=1 Tax=Falsiroseomonas oleicola TaxID=2801474 RepID=A0ABS6H9J4_9PROT|nr:hypothetical protein [Roseomonas oleicola]MBU8544000.1 hypothetical protein [Roseomonas oleicola]